MPKVNIKPIRSVERAIDVLQIFTSSKPRFTLDEVTQETKLPRSTVYRILCTLENKGFVQLDEKRTHYRPGLRLIELGLRLSSSLDVNQEAEDILVDLHNQTKQTVLMAVPDGNEILYVYKKETREGLKFSSVIGQRRPYIYGVLGPVLLAFEEEEKREQLLQQPIPQRTPDTVTDINVIRHRLDLIKETYYYIEADETTRGVVGIGAPVFDAHHNVVAAIGVVGPTVQLNEDRLAEIQPLVIQAAHTISKNMGFTGEWK